MPFQKEKGEAGRGACLGFSVPSPLSPKQGHEHKCTSARVVLHCSHCCAMQADGGGPVLRPALAH